jgi:chromosome segregation ATPase
MLLVAVSVQAQSIADVARKERERQAKLKPTLVVVSNQTITSEEPKPTTPPAGQAKPEDVKAATTESSKDAKAPAVDPVQAWNNRLAQLRDRLRTLQDQDTALQLQLNQTNNQVYATVTDPATQQRALAQVGQLQLQLSAVRKELDDTRKALDSMQLQGPPKK